MRSVSLALVSFVLLLLTSPTRANAQSISLNTIPLASGNQFLVFPSERLGMGGVQIALDDPLLDPFVNPARGARTVGSHFFTTPSIYAVGENSGSVPTLPVGALLGGDRWFGSAVVAVQQVAALNGNRRWNTMSDGSATNKLAFGSLGHSLADGKLAFGASAYVSDIRALDGSERLFAGSSEIVQSGYVNDFRLGTVVDLGETRALDVILLHSRVDVTHDVTYREWVVIDTINFEEEFQTRVEHEHDVTRTWGLHAGYQQPLGENGWRFGAIVTANRKHHPKIPMYVVVQEVEEREEVIVEPIPEDPGDSWAFNLGVGISRSSGLAGNRFTFGLDIVYQPAWSDTWAEAEEEITTESGSVIPVGGPTVENRFVFSNALANFGIEQEIDNVHLVFGLGFKLTDYWLDQDDLVAESSRHQKEQWTEWTPTWGIRADLGSVQLSYLGGARIGNGNSRVGNRERALGVVNQNSPDMDVLAAPARPVNMTIPWVWTHRFSVVLPIR
jgi:hypothetical protein